MKIHHESRSSHLHLHSYYIRFCTWYANRLGPNLLGNNCISLSYQKTIDLPNEVEVGGYFSQLGRIPCLLVFGRFHQSTAPKGLAAAPRRCCRSSADYSWRSLVPCILAWSSFASQLSSGLERRIVSGRRRLITGSRGSQRRPHDESRLTLVLIFAQFQIADSRIDQYPSPRKKNRECESKMHTMNMSTGGVKNRSDGSLKFIMVPIAYCLDLRGMDCGVKWHSNFAWICAFSPLNPA